MTVEVNPEHIPDELKERDQWLLWDDSHDTPRQPHWNGDFYGVSWSDPDDWHSFEDAVAAAQSNDSWGIGYVMAKDNDAYARGLYSCLDLDGCLDPERDEPKPKDWLPSLEDFIQDGGYIELSPSGDGLHIPLIGQDAPDWWTDSHFSADEHEGVEYLSHKFVTFTGDTLADSYDSVADTDPTDFLFRAFTEINGENPRVEPSDEARGHGGGDVDLDREDIEDALSHINSGCAYPMWRDIGFAVHDWDSGTTGKGVFEQWSRGSGWDDQAQRYVDSIWSNASQGDGVTVGTLIHHAKENGWTPPSPGPGPSQALPDDHDRRGGDEDYDYSSIEQSQPSWDEVRSYYEGESPQEGRVMAANALEGMASWMYVKESGKLWVYDDNTGYFNEWGETRIREIIERELGAFHSTGEVDQIQAKIEARNLTHRDQLNAGFRDEPLVCVANGVVNIATGELLDHSPEYRFTRGVPHDWNPDAVPERTLRFLRSVTKRDEDMWTIIQQLGHGLMPGHPFKAFVVMFGPGDNGKSALGAIMRHLVGSENAAGVELRDFDDDNFATGDLPGKMLNIGDDLSGKKIKDASMIKRLTSDDDTVRANEKYEKTFSFQNEAAMFFSGNEPPKFAEQTAALRGRLYPIHMPYRFTQEDDEHADADTSLVQRIVTDEEEMSGLLNLAIAGAQHLNDTGGQFAMPESPDERMEMYESASDPIRRFVMDCLVQGDGGDVAPKDDVFDVYTAMCRAENEQATSDQIFKSEISSQAIVDVENSRTRKFSDGEEQEYCWKYIKFSEDAREYMSDRLENRYFGEDDDIEDESDDVAFNASPISSCAETLTGYVTVTAEVLTVADIGDSGVKLVLEDSTGAIDLIAWDESAAEKLKEYEDTTIVVKNAEVGEYDGTRQLSVAGGVTSVSEIQTGVGYTEADTEDGNTLMSSSSTAATDGGGAQQEAEPDDTDEDDEHAEAKPVVMEKLYDLVEDAGNKPVDKEELVSALADDLEEDRVEETIEDLKTVGKIQGMSGGLIPQ